MSNPDLGAGVKTVVHTGGRNMVLYVRLERLDDRGDYTVRESDFG